MINQWHMIFPILVVLASPALSQNLFEPETILSPQRVVEIQLEALQENDSPAPDTGIVQTWIFAHPDNKRLTGPLERFTRMIKGPDYRNMIGHRTHKIEPVVQTADYALFAVAIITTDGQRLTFKWEVGKVRAGEFTGSWMTTSVSPPLSAEGST